MLDEDSKTSRTVRTVLVIDGYATGRSAVSAVMAELGYRVLEAATAAEGRTLVEQVEIDAIVADADDLGICRLVADVQAISRTLTTVMLTTRPLTEASFPNATTLSKPTGVDDLSNALASSLQR